MGTGSLAATEEACTVSTVVLSSLSRNIPVLAPVAS